MINTVNNEDGDARPLRMGFVWDVAGFGGRPARAKKRVQQRLDVLVPVVLNDLNVQLADTDSQGTGVSRHCRPSARFSRR